MSSAPQFPCTPNQSPSVPHHPAPPQPCQSNGTGVTATRDWVVANKGDADWQVLTEDRVPHVGVWGGETVDEACQSQSPWITPQRT